MVKWSDWWKSKAKILIKVIIKVKYYSKNVFGSIKDFLNNSKITVFHHYFTTHRFVTSYKEKAERFNSFLKNQCSLIKSDIKLPLQLQFLTDKHLSMIKFVSTDLLKIIQNLPSEKLMALIRSAYSDVENILKLNMQVFRTYI